MTCRICGNENAGLPVEGLNGNICSDCSQALFDLKHGDKQKASSYFQQFAGTMDKEMADYLALAETQNNEQPVVQELEAPPEQKIAAVPPEQANASYSPQNPESTENKNKKPKRLILEIAGGVLLIIFMFSAIGRVSKSDYQQLQNQYDRLSKTNDENTEELKEIKSELETTKSNFEDTRSEYAEYKKRMEPYEELETAEAEARKIEAEKVAAEKKAAEEKAAADKKAAEEKAAAEAAAAKAAEEARGYETGITYDQLARTPDDFKGQKVKFYGKVIQVLEGTSSVQIRLAVDDNYDTVLLGEYLPSIVTSRILDDDHITIYGTSVGTISYESTLGGTITIPGVYIDKIEQ